MRQIVRWTIGGNAHINGFKCLRMAIANWKKIYKDEFDLYVCCNGMLPAQVDNLRTLGVNLIRQEDFIYSLPIRPNKGPEWKLYPPRLAIDGHEIFMDNDLIIYKRLEILDQAMRSNFILASTGIEYSLRPGKHGAEGVFHKLIQNKRRLNSGFIYLPPYYNLLNEIIAAFNQLSIAEWKYKGDEQGLLAYILQNTANLIPDNIIACCNSNLQKNILGECGSHFLQLNKGKNPNFTNFVILKGRFKIY